MPSWKGMSIGSYFVFKKKQKIHFCMHAQKGNIREYPDYIDTSAVAHQICSHAVGEGSQIRKKFMECVRH